jgi:hypothetical protein
MLVVVENNRSNIQRHKIGKVDTETLRAGVAKSRLVNDNVSNGINENEDEAGNIEVGDALVKRELECRQVHSSEMNDFHI